MKYAFPVSSLLLSLIGCVRADTTVTLLAIVSTEQLDVPAPSETFKAIGVGSDGATTYDNIEVVSEYLVKQLNPPSIFSGASLSLSLKTIPPSTVTEPPITLHGTLVADASHYVYSLIPDPTASLGPPAQMISCDLNGSGGGSCVRRVWSTDVEDGILKTSTSTYSGVQTPVYTLVVQDANRNGLVRNEAHGPVLASLVIVATGLMLGAILGGF